MQSWYVIWFKDGAKFKKKFLGEKPRESGAIDYGKKLKTRGILEVHIVSGSHGFAPPIAQRQPPQPGMIWCPYCLKWREFVERAIKMKDGLLTPSLWRCPICTISIADHYVRMHNEAMVARLDHRSRTRVPSEKEIKRTIKRR